MKIILLCLVLHVTANFCCASSILRDDPEFIQSDLQPFTNTGKEENKKYEGSECKCPRFPRPVDCSEVLANGNNVSGVYTIYPKSRAINCDTLEVYCDMDTDGGGWIVIQRRGDYGNAENYFVKNWETYKNGFGNSRKEFWLGNDIIHAITNQHTYSLRLDMRKVNGDAAFGLYDTFWIEDEERNYKLHIKGDSGTAGVNVNTHDLSLFYTQDRPNFPAGRKAGDKQHVGGWWFNIFPSTNLNGLNKQGAAPNQKGIHWLGFSGYDESLGHTEMKVRPKRFHS